MTTIGQRIASLREKHGLSQAELAKHFNIGTSTLGMWETDKRRPSTDMLVVIAQFFNVTTDYLLGRNETPQWATNKDTTDLAEFLEKNADTLMYQGEKMTTENKQKLEIALTQIFWQYRKKTTKDDL